MHIGTGEIDGLRCHTDQDALTVLGCCHPQVIEERDRTAYRRQRRSILCGQLRQRGEIASDGVSSGDNSTDDAGGQGIAYLGTLPVEAPLERDRLRFGRRIFGPYCFQERKQVINGFIINFKILCFQIVNELFVCMDSQFFQGELPCHLIFGQIGEAEVADHLPVKI